MQDLAEPVLFDAVRVLPLRLNPDPLTDRVGLPVSVPVFTPFVNISRVAVVVIKDVPPLAAIVVGLALTLTFQFPYVITLALNLTSNVRALVTLNV